MHDLVEGVSPWSGDGGDVDVLKEEVLCERLVILFWVGGSCWA